MLGRLVHSISVRLGHLRDEQERELLRARLGSIGRGGTLGAGIHITRPDRVRLGQNVHIGRGAWIRADGGLIIGDNTHISRNCVIFTVNHDWNGDRLPYDEQLVTREVEIGPNVWIGMNVCIAPGTRIGEGAIVGMGTVVTGEVPPLAMIAGQKWRVIGERDAAHYELLKGRRAFGAASGAPF
jgi:acetyltransferase-like isoleucine patch superfamily enzyme